jgi:DNA-binding GntR family transcriptional regulator
MQAASLPTLTDIAYAKVRDLVRQREIVPGDLLSEVALARQMKMSRTPVREALSRLVQEGLVSVLPRKGVMVRRLGIADLEDLYAIRELLEGLSARTAAQRASAKGLQAVESILNEMEQAVAAADVSRAADLDMTFHRTIAQEGGNLRLLRMIEQLHNAVMLDELRERSLAIPGRFQKSLDEHRAVCLAIASRDPDRAEALMREHAQSYLRSLTSFTFGRGEQLTESPTARLEMKSGG